MKKHILFFLVIVNILLMVSCAGNYGSKKNENYYTVIVNNSLHFELNGDKSTQINVLEKDNYGRILFECINGISCYFILGICQKSDETNVYFYEDECIIDFGSYSDITEQIKSDLKTANDWNCELNESKMVSKNIEKASDFSGRGGGVDTNREKMKGLFSRENSSVSGYYITKNDAGLKMYTVEVLKNDTYSETSIGESPLGKYVVVLDSNDSLISGDYILKLEDPFDYKEQLIAFKKNIGWYKQ